MLEVCRASLGYKVVLVYQEGSETKGTTGTIREANENFILVETDNKRKVWIKPETIIKVKEVQEVF